uniref:Uncharacterized protein n=1 Tax=Arundo donax TaxID=35708 RepID=A0A0A9C6N7_ARUDO
MCCAQDPQQFQVQFFWAILQKIKATCKLLAVYL